ncbi:MAG: RNA polymerase-binding protein DksA [Holosporaceae bacterium]|jgi:DnaK suppressor protein|nr:RNA polymerase-binding protein DksA [Holosporaceae bacterium]
MDDKICELPRGYRPSKAEQFMSNFQREYFRRKLVKWKGHILRETEYAMKCIQEEGKDGADSADLASTETGLTYGLRSKERAHRLINKIDAALQKIKNGTYGYCEETGEPISLDRLKARPVAMLSIEAQERHEKKERTQSDDDE